MRETEGHGADTHSRKRERGRERRDGGLTFHRLHFGHVPCPDAPYLPVPARPGHSISVHAGAAPDSQGPLASKAVRFDVPAS